MSNNLSFVLIIEQYHALLERYARRYMHNKQMAYSVVREVFETLYDKGSLKAGPHLRSVLKNSTRTTWQKIDDALRRAEEALGGGMVNGEW